MREYVPCNLCQSNRSRPFLMTPVESLVRCLDCGLVYTNPRPAVSASRYEEEFFLKEYKAVYGVDYIEDRENISKIARARLDAIERYRRGVKLLDVGCAAGFLLDEARRRGWEVRGVEISQYASGYAREQLGLEIVTGTLEDAKFPPEEFDVVVVYFVLEHLHDPFALLKEIYRILRPHGLVSVAVPNIRGLYFLLNRRGWLAERAQHQSHLYEFSPRTLRGLFVRSGFYVLNLTSEGKYAKGHLLAPLVGRLGLGNVLLAQAIKR